MAQIRFDWKIIIDDVDSATLPITKTKTLSYTTIEDKTYSIADSGSAQSFTATSIWNPTLSGSDIETSTDFDFLVIISDKAIYLELTNDLSDDGTDDINIIPIAAGMPLILGSDDGFNDYPDATGIAATSGLTAQVFERLRVVNDSGATATVRVIIGS